jgi:hypothetical protein
MITYDTSKQRPSSPLPKKRYLKTKTPKPGENITSKWPQANLARFRV